MRDAALGRVDVLAFVIVRAADDLSDDGLAIVSLQGVEREDRTVEVAVISRLHDGRTRDNRPVVGPRRSEKPIP